ncbi:hypothetical protein [Parabacteroides sp. PF5-6]|uniref:DUF6941 family protein n=1 Tax=Parabacteroides sp. PF5-6 TaxID=1742403 RepID=UPI002405F0C7|nr:hypothetical protein [Parabacteroides sp. PF5-6]MDF9829343.1 hypothetical protein [Parabacteroides sp. PF5-6]
MDVELFTLCDFAQINQEKFTIVGTFNSLFPQVFPFRYSSFYVACRIRLEKGEEGDKAFSFSIRENKPNGKDLITPVKGDIHVVPDDNIDAYISNFVLSFNNIEFTEPAHYNVVFECCGFKKTIPLFVKKTSL